MKGHGDECGVCKDSQKPERLVLVNGALVCRTCDNVASWPSQRR